MGVNYGVFDKGLIELYYDDDRGGSVSKLIFEIEGHSNLVVKNDDHIILQSTLKLLLIKPKDDAKSEFYLSPDDEGFEMSLYTYLLKRDETVYIVFIAPLPNKTIDDKYVSALLNKD